MKDIPKFSEQDIFNMKLRGEIIEFNGYDCLDMGIEIAFKDDVKCKEHNKIIKAGEKAGTWYIPVRYPEKTIIKWECGCLDIKDRK